MKIENIIVACDTFLTGGAETFALRMARYYRERGHNVYLFAYIGDSVDWELIKHNAGADIPLLTFSPNNFINWLVYKIDGLLQRFSIFNTLRRLFVIRFCKRIINDKDIDVIHTNLLGSLDVWCQAAQINPKVRVLHTIHGDLISYLYYSIVDKRELLKARDIYYLKKLVPGILSRVNFFVCPAEMHLRIFERFGSVSMDKVKKIYYPVGSNLGEVKGSISRDTLGIPINAFVFGSVARGTREKGWENLIQAFIKVNLPNSYLILVGDGPFIPYLRNKFDSFENVVFVGNQSRPLDYVRLFNVGISASFFWESLPTAIIEYLSVGKPVICTDNAESAEMIKTNSGMAGIVVPLEKDGWGVVTSEPPKPADLEYALEKIYIDDTLRHQMQENAVLAFKKFDKHTVLQQYESLFNK